MKTRSKRSFFSGRKLLLILLVVLASALFIWQYVFVKNTTGSKAAKGGGVHCCTTKVDCNTGEFCMKLSGSEWDACGFGSCEPEEKSNGAGAVKIRCNCTTEFGPCGDKWGQTNIKSRQCNFALNGTEKCNFRTGAKLYQWVSCVD